PAHFLEYLRSEHGVSLARGGADRPPRPRPRRESVLSSGAEGMLEQAACDELLGRLHHVLPHLERSPLLIDFCFNDTAATEIYTLSLHDALPPAPPATA